MTTSEIRTALLNDTLDGYHYAPGILCSHDAATGNLTQIGKMSIDQAVSYIADALHDDPNTPPPGWAERRERSNEF